MRVASGPDPPGSSRCVFERRRTSVSRVCLSVTLATPASSGSTDTPWLCRGRLPPIPAPPKTGCPQLQPPRCDGTAAKVSHLHSINKRLTAHLLLRPIRVDRQTRPLDPLDQRTDGQPGG